jgi:hypothetical protein
MNESQLQAIITALEQITTRIGQAADTLQQQAQKMQKSAVIDTADKEQNEQLRDLSSQNKQFQTSMFNVQNILSSFMGKQQQQIDEESVRNKVQDSQIQNVRIIGITSDVAQLLSSNARNSNQQEQQSGSLLMRMLMPLLGLLGAAGAAMGAFESGPGPVGSLLAAVTKFADVITGFKNKIGSFADFIGRIPQQISNFFGKNFDDLLASINKRIESVFPQVAAKIADIGISIGKRATDIIELVPGGFKRIASMIGSALGAVFKGGIKGLKLIPYIGNLVNLYFAYERFSTGDIKGGFLELASGLSDFVPGIGNILGIGLDLYLMYRDVTTTPEERTSLAPGMFKSMLQSIKSFFISALSNIPNMPVLGNIFRFGQGIQRILSGDVAGGMRQSIGAVVGWVPFAGGAILQAFDALSSFFSMSAEPVNAAANVAPSSSLGSTIGGYIRQKFSSLGSFARGAIAAVGGPLAAMFASFGASGDAELSGMLRQDNSSAIVQNINQVGADINNSYTSAINAIDRNGINKLNELAPSLQNLDANLNSLNAGSLNQLQDKMASISSVAQQAAQNTQLISQFAERASASMPTSISGVTADITSEQNVTNSILSDYSNNSQALMSRLLEANIQQINVLNMLARIMDAKSFDVNVNPQINLQSEGGAGDNVPATSDQVRNGI